MHAHPEARRARFMMAGAVTVTVIGFVALATGTAILAAFAGGMFDMGPSDTIPWTILWSVIGLALFAAGAIAAGVLRWGPRGALLGAGAACLAAAGSLAGIAQGLRDLAHYALSFARSGRDVEQVAAFAGFASGMTALAVVLAAAAIACFVAFFAQHADDASTGPFPGEPQR